MAGNGKRKAESKEGQTKRVKYSKFKATNRGNDNTLSSSKTIEPGTAGIWATCVRGLEAKATVQLRDLLDEYASMLYPETFPPSDDAAPKDQAKLFEDEDKDDDDDDDDEDGGVDIESAIKSELADAKTASQKQIFKTVRIDIACVLFFKVDPPIDPVALVMRICEDAAAGKSTQRTRHINRLTPMTLLGKATPDAIAKVAQQVLAPHFHGDGIASRKFAIRPTIRNNNVVKRQELIQQVADIVGDKHTVDLSNPDLVILVDVYTNVCGMSVVDGIFEKKLKRFNLNELFGSLKDNKEDKPAASSAKAKPLPESGS